MSIGPTISIIPVVIGALFAFGIVYNLFVSWLERHGYEEGYLAILVAVGCSVVIGGVALINWQAALLSLTAFTAAGTPMLIGSWWRHVQARTAGQAAQRREAVEDRLP